MTDKNSSKNYDLRIEDSARGPDISAIEESEVIAPDHLDCVPVDTIQDNTNEDGSTDNEEAPAAAGPVAIAGEGSAAVEDSERVGSVEEAATGEAADDSTASDAPAVCDSSDEPGRPSDNERQPAGTRPPATIIRRPVGFRHKPLDTFSKSLPLLFGSIVLIAIGCQVAFPGEPFWLFAAFFSVPMIASIIQIVASKRAHLFFDPSHIVKVGAFRTARIREADVTEVRWGRIRSMVTVFSRNETIKISFEEYEIEDRLTIAELLRSAIPERLHKNWHYFTRYANRWYERVHQPEHDSTPDREPEEHEYLRTRKRVGIQVAIMIVLMQVLTWSLLLPSLLADSDLATVMSVPSASLIALFPLAYWLMWPVFYFMFPKEGRIEKKMIKSELERAQGRRAFKTFVYRLIPFVLLAIIWIPASRFALGYFFALDEAALEMATFFGGVIFLAAAMLLLIEPELNAPENEFDEEVAKWNEREARLAVLPETPARREVISGRETAGERVPVYVDRVEVQRVEIVEPRSQPSRQQPRRQRDSLSDNDGIIFR
ncbi:MAG: hypothetical protein AAF456_10640 [Planctomycetota bacterium]